VKKVLVKPAAKPKASAKPTGPSERESISIRKIVNGYLVTKSTESPKGYKSEEMYSPSKPIFDFKPGKKP